MCGVKFIMTAAVHKSSHHHDHYHHHSISSSSSDHLLQTPYKYRNHDAELLSLH